MKVKTSELTGAALDWAVAKAWQPAYSDKHLVEHAKDFTPSTDWSQGGPIIEREVCTLIERDGEWSAEVFWPKPPSRHRFCYSVRGETPLIAAMRTYVVSRLGAEVDVPGELLK
jgi:hypothetical protein